METHDLIKLEARKIKILYLGVALIVVVLVGAMFLFHRPKVTVDNMDIRSIETERRASEKQSQALLQLALEQAKSTRFFAERDSLLQIEIRLNRKAIENIKLPHETIVRITNYGSAELANYFANLPEPR